MPAPSHCVARVEAATSGEVFVRVVAAGLRREVASRALRMPEPFDNGILVIGQPTLRSMRLGLPARHCATAATSCNTSVEARLGQWLAALRAHGIVRFDVPGDGRIQRVPESWLEDAVLREILSGALSPVPAFGPPADNANPEVSFDEAPDHSILGLMRDADWRGAIGWSCDLPDELRRTLTLPLFATGAAGNGAWQFGWWQRPVFRDPFSLGEAVVLTLGDGPPRGETRPIGIGHSWDFSQDARGPVDPAWHWRGDVRLDRIAHHLVRKAERVLTHAACSRGFAGERMERELDEVARLRRRLESRLFRLIGEPANELLRRSAITHLPAPRLTHAAYLHGEGEASVIARRAQVLSLWPSLANDLARANTPHAVRAVDAGAPLLPALAADFELPGWAVRRLLRLLSEIRLLPREFNGLRTLGRLIAAAGPHAPPLRGDDLPRLAAWLRYVPDAPSENWPFLLMGLLGRTAATDGWSAAGDELDRDDHGGFQLLGWWHDLFANIMDVFGLATDDEDGVADANTVLVAWLADLGLEQGLRLARTWHAFVNSGFAAPTVPVDEDELVHLFDPCTLPRTGARVIPLGNLESLRAEGSAMAHCVASHWLAVASGERLIVSIQDPAGARATVSLRLGDDGHWHCVEARGPANATLVAEGVLVSAVAEFVSLLDAGALIAPEAMAAFREAATHRQARPADQFVDGGCLVSRLSPPFARAALRWMPGQGSVRQRVRHAARRAGFNLEDEAERG